MSEKQEWKVAAACVVVDVEGAERYIYRGGILPAGVSAASITRLSNVDLIVPVDAEEARNSVPVDAITLPDGTPSAQWKVDQLKAYALRNGIELGAASRKGELLEVITSALGLQDPAAPVPGPVATSDPEPAGDPADD